ncbi:butyrophilin subfamily 1 member A1-like [Takifugu rubripes]|uniref:butyrophilin subfamily 1 member A1-like n=1 Tax=Takifugu rubripes TaxID=31033 RepID=UPI0011458D96|nr:butyrophilin subfamily 1 member A1-like [Takifugu rubripes]
MSLLAILPRSTAALLFLVHATTASDFFLKSSPSVSVQRGHTATLPCWLEPTQSAELLEVLWYHRNDVDLSVMRYSNKKVSSLSSYEGRVSFGPRGVTSGGLASGDVSLELVNVTLQDSGEYTCYVSSDQSHDTAVVTLAVTETGGPLHLSAVWTDSSVVNVSCRSEGWYPRPQLRWLNQNESLTPKSIQYTEDSLGLLSVHSWVLVSPSSEIICTVGLQGEEEKETRLHLSTRSELPQTECTHLSAGMVAVVVLLTIMTIITIIFGIAFYKSREKKIKSQRKIRNTEEEKNKLLSKVMDLTNLLEAKKNYVNIKITNPEGGHPHLLIKALPNGYVVRDKRFPNGSKVSMITAITGTNSFSTGEHYWEVSLGNTNTDPKRSWWLGVTSVFNIPVNADFCPTESKGYWFLSSSSSENPDFFQLSTEPPTLLPVNSRPERVGVYLNCETGTVIFYDVDNSSIIGRLTGDFQGEVFPFFNPGLFDAAPLMILHHNKTDPFEL